MAWYKFVQRITTKSSIPRYNSSDIAYADRTSIANITAMTSINPTSDNKNCIHRLMANPPPP